MKKMVNEKLLFIKIQFLLLTKLLLQKNNTVDAGATVTFIVTVENAKKLSNANTVSYEVQLKDIETSEISNVSKYLNA